MSILQTDNIPVFTALKQSATSGAYDVSKRQVLSVEYITENNSGSEGDISLQVSNDGVNWVTYNRLTKNVTDANNKQDTRVGTIHYATNTKEIYQLSDGDHFRYFRGVIVYEGPIGTVSIANGGTGYSVADELGLTTAGDTAGTVFVNTVDSNGKVTSVSVGNTAGMYQVASALPAAGGDGSGCTINILSLLVDQTFTMKVQTG